MINIENKVKAKYSTKNNNTSGSSNFLPTKNQRKARRSSDRNLIPMALRVWIAWVSGGFFCPVIKTIIITEVITVKIRERIREDANFRSILTFDTRT